MSDKIANTQDRPEEKPLTEQELQFCNLYAVSYTHLTLPTIRLV